VTIGSHRCRPVLYFPRVCLTAEHLRGGFYCFAPLLCLLLILWGIGLVSSFTVGGFIHILLVLAIIASLVRIIQGRRPVF
jgi:Family of unknown function (DUF5670)